MMIFQSNAYCEGHPNKVDMQGLDGNRILDMTLQDNHVKHINTTADKMIKKSIHSQVDSIIRLMHHSFLCHTLGLTTN